MNRVLALAAVTLLAAGPAIAQTPTSGNANLSVASVKTDDGLRASKLIGANVYGDPATQVAIVDDLILTPDHRVALAILAVGGLMGVGSKLVAVPISQLQHGADGRLTMPGATKDGLTAMPTFVYNG